MAIMDMSPCRQFEIRPALRHPVRRKLTFKIMIRKAAQRFASHCPYCKSIEFRGVGVRNALERAILWLLQPYRCSLCGHHFFLFPMAGPHRGDGVMGTL